ncbi:hypothetical protein [Phormidium sp. FACHB-1136]|uniref:hypothetical protein n=1 Tax=Phormidium sp. FACHB-1136 TaxID=2692848 RepID=UPI001687B67E|nr:hypothetical protein [Phormidium sp. FACHB-1136]MBD2424581.1 hypothetical protein [Phormidium sp. FACHB-1136]
MHQTLLLFSLWTIFSINVFGLAFYPSFLAILFLLLRKKLKYPKKIILLIIGFLGLSIIAILLKPYLFIDLIRFIILFLYFLYLKAFCSEEKLHQVIDVSVAILVIYGVFQYIAIITGNIGYATGLFEQIGASGQGGAYDTRGGILRVASLTSEPSYFAFTVGVYFFITKKTIIKFLCIIGYIISFSYISIYAALGITGFLLWKKLLKLNLFSYMLFVFFIHTIFVYTYYQSIVALDIGGTFSARYGGLDWYLRSSAPEMFLGVFNVPEEVTIRRGFSNISSLVVNFGLLGFLGYCYFLSKLGRFNNVAVLAIYLYGFNYYYMTAWPTFIVFIYMIYVNGKSISVRNYPMLQFRKDYSESSMLSERTDPTC